MCPQTRRCPVLFAADDALKRPEFSVRPRVDLQTPRIGKCLRTLHAEIRFVEGVRSHVKSHPLLCPKLLVTPPAFVRIFIFKTVTLQVFREVRRVTELKSAKPTHVFPERKALRTFCNLMNSLVKPPRKPVGETLSAGTAQP